MATTHDTRSIDEALADLDAHRESLSATLTRISDIWHERLAALPPPETRLESLLEALARSEDHTEENFQRWPRGGMDRNDPRHPYQLGSECFVDWGRACDEKQAAVTALLRYARALREGR